MSPLTQAEKTALAAELRDIYIHCVTTGLVPSSAFLKLERVLKESGNEIYHVTLRSDIDLWLVALEEEMARAHSYSAKEVEFVEDMRSEFERDRGTKPLSTKQLKWLKALYDRI